MLLFELTELNCALAVATDTFYIRHRLPVNRLPSSSSWQPPPPPLVAYGATNFPIQSADTGGRDRAGVCAPSK